MFIKTAWEKLRKYNTQIIMVFLSISWFLIGWHVREFFLSQDVLIVEQARNIILDYYNGDTPSSRELTYAAVRGMLYSLNDPRAVFYEPDLVTREHEDNLGEYAGTGMRGELQDEGLIITYVNPGEPAEQAGLQVGDVIIGVDDWKIKKDTTYKEISLMIRGPSGSTAHLDVQRGDDALELDVTRNKAVRVITKTIEPNLAYLYLRDFGINSSQEVKQGLESLLIDNPQGLIWDLRGNGGGALTETVTILDYFMGEQVFLYSESKEGTLYPHQGTKGGIAIDIPLVVLIDHHSYSAPEVVAAAISDLDRGILIGETTYGKGTINTTFHLLDASAMQMTVARWLSPAKHWYGGTGVPPDVQAEDNETTTEDEVLECAIAWFLAEHSISESCNK